MKEITELSRLTDEEVLALYNESVLESGSTFIAATSCNDPGNHGCNYYFCYNSLGQYFYTNSSGLKCFDGSVVEVGGITEFEADPTYGAVTNVRYYYFYTNFTACQTSAGSSSYSPTYCHVDVQK